MPTSKKRLNISLTEELEKMISYLAERDQVPQATKALHLIQMAIELDEDEVWNAIAEKRDKKGTKYTSHEEFWSQAL